MSTKCKHDQFKICMKKQIYLRVEFGYTIHHIGMYGKKFFLMKSKCGTALYYNVRDKYAI